MKLPWLLDGSVRNVFPSSLYCLILIRCIVFIASAKIREREGNSFYGQLPDYKPQLLAYSTEQMSSTFCYSCFFSSDLHSSERGGAVQCVWSVCRWLSKWRLIFVGVWCYTRRLVWVLRALAQFKVSEGSPGLFQDFVDEYIKHSDSPSYCKLNMV